MGTVRSIPNSSGIGMLRLWFLMYLHLMENLTWEMFCLSLARRRESPGKNGYAFNVQIEKNPGAFYELATKAYFGVSYEDYDSHERSYVYDR